MQTALLLQYPPRYPMAIQRVAHRAVAAGLQLSKSQVTRLKRDDSSRSGIAVQTAKTIAKSPKITASFMVDIELRVDSNTPNNNIDEYYPELP